MKLKTIILREKTEPAAGNAEFALAGVAAKGFAKAKGKSKGKAVDAKTLTLEVAETSAAERNVLRSEKGTLIATSMPMVPVKSLALKIDPAVKPPPASWGIAAVGAQDNTKPALTGKGAVVAVLDTGIDPTHPAFAGVQLIQKNFTSDADENDSDGHGTHCAGTIFGRDVGGSRIGIAPGVSKALIGKVIGEDGAETDGVVKAIYWAVANGAHIISMSLGIDFMAFRQQLIDEDKLAPDHATSIALAGYRDTVRVFDKISDALSSGPANIASAVVAAAAGNESDRPNYAITVAPPAAAELFLSVAAVSRPVGNVFKAAKFSNDGAKFAAPGVDIWSAQLTKRGGGLVADSGTSMATPHVAGVAARWTGKLLAEGEEFTAAKVIDEMKRASLTITPGVPKSDALHGLVQGPK